MKHKWGKTFIIMIFVGVFSFSTFNCGSSDGNNGGGGSQNDTSGSQSNNNVVKGTYYGNATIDIWYLETLYSPEQQKTYEVGAVIDIDDPLVDDFGVEEDNPFHIKVIVSGFNEIITAIFETAILYRCDGVIGGLCDNNLKDTLIQYWYFSASGGSYSGTYDPGIEYRGAGTIHVENISCQAYWDSNPLIHYTCPPCIGAMSTGTSISIVFSENQLKITIAGEIGDTGYQSDCEQNIDKFELEITAEI